jgi:ribosome-associated protein YbcJ (S4-like RNA binding protein)
MEFKLKTEFVELDNMSKILELVANGAEAKQQIQAGLVKVNNKNPRQCCSGVSCR